MSLVWQMTDTAMGCSPAAFCSALSANSSNSSKQGSVGASAGTGTTAQAIQANAAARYAVFYELVVPSGVTNIAAGNWTVTLDVTVANSNLTWTRITICRVNSGCASQASVLADTTISVALSTTGVKSSGAQSGSAVTVSAGDKIIVVLSFTNGKNSSQSFTWKADGTITAAGAVTYADGPSLASSGVFAAVGADIMPVSISALASSGTISESGGIAYNASNTLTSASAFQSVASSTFDLSNTLSLTAALSTAAQNLVNASFALSSTSGFTTVGANLVLISMTLTNSSSADFIGGNVVSPGVSLDSSSVLASEASLSISSAVSLSSGSTFASLGLNSLFEDLAVVSSALFSIEAQNAIVEAFVASQTTAFTSDAANLVSESVNVASSTTLTVESSNVISVASTIAGTTAVLFEGTIETNVHNVSFVASSVAAVGQDAIMSAIASLAIPGSSSISCNARSLLPVGTLLSSTAQVSIVVNGSISDGWSLAMFAAVGVSTYIPVPPSAVDSSASVSSPYHASGSTTSIGSSGSGTTIDSVSEVKTQ